MSNRVLALAVAVVAVLSACGEEGDVLTRPDRDERSAGRASREPSRNRTRPSRSEKKERPPRHSRARVEKDPRSAPRGPRAFVSRVIDGDTIEVDLRGTEVGVRLIGFDTPETVHPTEPVECFGKAASSYTNERLLGRTIRLEFDVERRDHYGRTLAYVWVGDHLFNEEVLRDGFAQVSTYPPNVKYVDRFLDAQRKARDASRGLWSRCDGDRAVRQGPGNAAPTKVVGGGRCDPAYSGACVPPYPPDIDCSDLPAGDFRSKGSDPHGFDGDGDGIACES